MLITPKKIHSHVQKLCEKIGAGTCPIYVSVIPEQWAVVNECFYNVAEKLKYSGGAIQHGWCIWERPGLFIEGEFHGVWLTPAGELIDITPKRNQEERILFLPDNKRVFNEKSFSRMDNIRLPIHDSPLVSEFLNTAKAYFEYKENSSDPENPRLMRLSRGKVMEFEMKMSELEYGMIRLPIERNDICRCGSGEKYKKCCGK